MKTTVTTLLAAVAALAITSGAPAAAETRVTYKSAAVGTAYYQMGVDLSEAIKAGTEEEIILTLEESQGSVQNVMETAARSGNYIFTTPPALVTQALAGEGPFAERNSPKYQEIRGLFPIPAITMHIVVAGDEGVISSTDLRPGTRSPQAEQADRDKGIPWGKASFAASERSDRHRFQKHPLSCSPAAR